MDISPVIPKGRQLITGYGAGGFKINQEWVEGSLLVFPDRIVPWPVTGVEQLDPALLIAEKSDVELLLLGTGKTLLPIDPSVRQALKAAGVALEIMDTGAACRTYNVLLSEERRVAAALIALQP